MLTSALTGISFWRIAIDVYYICNTFLFKVHAVTLSASCPRYSIPLSNSCRFSKSVRWINFIVWTPLLSNDHRSVLNLWKCNYRMMSQLLRLNIPQSLYTRSLICHNCIGCCVETCMEPRSLVRLLFTQFLLWPGLYTSMHELLLCLIGSKLASHKVC